jgi:aldehyde dehydrogenase (NAD+)
MLRYYAGLCDKIEGRIVDSNQCHLSYVLKEPVGVCALITPWNSSLRNVISKLSPALAMGNTCVVKVSELTPLSALRLAALVKEAGFPPGVVNILAGIGDKAGEHLVTHPLVNKISFGGCTSTGKRILSLAAGTVKRVTASLGGKSASVICSDADLQYATKTTCEGMFRNSGESCTSLCRVYVHETLYDAFIAQAIQYCKTQKLGDPFDDASTMGPMATDSQFLRTIGYIDRAKEGGAKLLIGGNTKDKFVEPTIFVNVSDEMEISRNEIFGPVMCVFSFKNDEEAINRVNNSQYGLWAAVFTKSMIKSSKYSKELKVGTVAINCNSTSTSLPFGGFRESGFGREGGLEGLYSYTEVKVVNICTSI